MIGTADCCAEAANCNVAAALQRAVINSRRCIGPPKNLTSADPWQFSTLQPTGELDMMRNQPPARSGHIAPGIVVGHDVLP